MVSTMQAKSYLLIQQRLKRKGKFESFMTFPKKPSLLRDCSTGLLKMLWAKEIPLKMSSFSFFHSVFYHFGEFFCHFHQIKIHCLQTPFGRKGLKFVTWDRVKIHP